MNSRQAADATSYLLQRIAELERRVLQFQQDAKAQRARAEQWRHRALNARVELDRPGQSARSRAQTRAVDGRFEATG